MSLGVVLVSTFTFVLGTFPEFQKVNIIGFNFKYLLIPPSDLQEEDTGQPPPYPEAVIVMDIVGNALVNAGCRIFVVFPLQIGRNYIQDL